MTSQDPCLRTASHDVADQILVERKTAKAITDTHLAVARSYLRAIRRQHGLILNFAKPTLDIKRVQGG